MADCGFWLRLNGEWVPLPGVQAGVQVAAERRTDGFVSVGGVQHLVSARRAPRSWQLDLGHAGPEAVAALAVAAQGDGGDVWLWDESAARENLLDPIAARGVDAYLVVDCGGLPLMSLTQGSAGPPVTRDVALKANVVIFSGGEARGLELGDGMDALVKVSVPPTPSGQTLLGAELVLTAAGSGGSSDVDAYAASNAWVEPVAHSNAGYWWSVPAGSLVGSASPVSGVWSIPLTGVDSFAGADMSLRLVGDALLVDRFVDRAAASNVPVLRLTYESSASESREIVLPPLRPGEYTLSGWTDADPDTVLGELDPGSSWVAGSTPELGTMRRVSQDFTLSGPVTLTLPDSDEYLLAGVGLATLDHDTYMPGRKTPTRVKVEDPTLTLDMLYSGEQGRGPRSVTIREVGR